MNLALILQQRGYELCSDCEENNCELNMNGVKNYAIIKGESITQHEKMADCLIFHEEANFSIVVCELKSNYLKPERIKKQIQNGVNHALKILEHMPLHTSPEIILVVLSKTLKVSYVKSLRRAGIETSGKQFPIFARPCDRTFSEILNIPRQ